MAKKIAAKYEKKHGLEAKDRNPRMSEKERVNNAVERLHNDRLSVVDDKRDKDYRRDDLMDAEDEETEDKMVELYRSKRVLSKIDEENSSQLAMEFGTERYNASPSASEMTGMMTHEQYGMFTTPSGTVGAIISPANRRNESSNSMASIGQTTPRDERTSPYIPRGGGAPFNRN